MNFRIGEGWDTHALVPGRALVIGGVHIPHSMGLLGHSDADVLLHAITDALLGAAGLGDIGKDLCRIKIAQRRQHDVIVAQGGAEFVLGQRQGVCAGRDVEPRAGSGHHRVGQGPGDQ